MDRDSSWVIILNIFGIIQVAGAFKLLLSSDVSYYWSQFVILDPPDARDVFYLGP